jgi:ATP adenylyltransferase
MSYQQLADFITQKMRMSHIYQPVMLMTLLKSNGASSERQIAEALLSHDESQIEYYTDITNNMVGRVLRSHGLVERQNKNYKLVGYDALTPEETANLISLCQEKLAAFLKARGQTIFDHRRKSIGYIPGTVKYEVLSRAKFRCELCGISADERALEVDHILPRNFGGSDDPSNLQSLCYSCNAMKRDRDDTDFRKIRESYQHRLRDCVFCNIDANRIIDQNELAYAIHDAFPVTALHTLIIPKRHLPSYFEMGQSEINACSRLLLNAKQRIQSEDPLVDGFNIGINDGETAGQTIFHCHTHLIPRRKGDVAKPRGGIRHLIPGKGQYH